MADSGQEQKPNFCQRLGNGCTSFCTFLHNKETGEVMGRSGQSWAKIGVFYLFFYGFLAAFFSSMLAVFMTTIENPDDGGKPKLTQFIENQPGLTRLDYKFEKEANRLKTYNSASNTSSYANSLIEVFTAIRNNSVYKGPCSLDKNNVTKPCYAPFSEYGPCQPDADIKKSMFGLKDKKPCIFLKINKVYGWVPAGDKYLELVCSGDALVGHYPEGFLLNGFPYVGDRSQHLPFVAVQVDATKKVEVKCYLKGANIKVSDSYNPARSFGNILIEDITAK